MAIGYGKLILQHPFGRYFETLLVELNETYKVFVVNTLDSIIALDDTGDPIVLNPEEIIARFNKHKIVNFKVLNHLDNAATVSIAIIDNYLIEESYSMDELLSEQEFDDLLIFLKRRFDRLLGEKKAIGFVFDPSGYSEDYILIPPPNWKTSDDCWRKLMGG